MFLPDARPKLLVRYGGRDPDPAERVGGSRRGEAGAVPREDEVEAELQPGEEQAQEGEPAQDTAAAEGGQEASDDTLENIVEDLKRKNASE